MYRLFWLLNTFGWVVGIIFLWLVLMICAHSVLQATVETVKELIKKHEEFDKRMQTNDDKINQMIQFADRLNDENHYASDKITEKARSIDERREQLFFYYYFLFLFFIIRFSSVPASSPYLLPPLHSSSLADLLPLLLLICCLTFFPFPFLPAFPCSSILLPLNLHGLLPSYSSSVLTLRFPLSQEERKSRKDGGSIEEVERCFGASTIHPRLRRCKCLLWTTHDTIQKWRLINFKDNWLVRKPFYIDKLSRRRWWE